jgi:hypothetical protein
MSFFACRVVAHNCKARLITPHRMNEAHIRELKKGRVFLEKRLCSNALRENKYYKSAKNM